MLLGDPGRQVAKLISADEKAIRRGIARTLTRAAGIAQDTLIAKEQSTFRSASRFMTMTQGYRIEPAKPDQRDPTSTFRVTEKQAAVLMFSITGGARGPGDPGVGKSGQAFVPTAASPKTAAGAIRVGFSREIVGKIKAQKKRRRRRKPIEGRQMQGFWLGTRRNGKGDDGLWRRPDRTTPMVTFGLDGKPHLARPADKGRQVRNLGHPVLLAERKDVTVYPGDRIDFVGIANAAFDQAIGPGGSELTRRFDDELSEADAGREGVTMTEQLGRWRAAGRDNANVARSSCGRRLT